MSPPQSIVLMVIMTLAIIRARGSGYAIIPYTVGAQTDAINK